jgi:uncharacterized MAPEG superfamily protein
MRQYGATWALSARDAEAPPLNTIPARFDRNFRTYKESFSFFAVAILAAELAGLRSALTRRGAITYLGARFVYTALYLSEVPIARSVAWNIAAAGMLAVVVAPFVSR